MKTLSFEMCHSFDVFAAIVGNGYISTDTLKEILRELDNKLSEADLDNIIEEVDEDGSGTLDFDGK